MEFHNWEKTVSYASDEERSYNPKFLFRIYNYRILQPTDEKSAGCFLLNNVLSDNLIVLNPLNSSQSI